MYTFQVMIKTATEFASPTALNYYQQHRALAAVRQHQYAMQHANEIKRHAKSYRRKIEMGIKHQHQVMDFGGKRVILLGS